MDVPKCASWMGHKFEARYSKGAVPLASFKQNAATAEEVTATLDGFREITYERDICIRCGYVIEKAAK
jgi:hypothetical protein